MSDDAARFRRRAEQCRDLAERARDEYSRSTLSQLAAELDHEADKIDAEEGGDEDDSPT
jgi:hypothetical protein